MEYWIYGKTTNSIIVDVNELHNIAWGTVLIRANPDFTMSFSI